MAGTDNISQNIGLLLDVIKVINKNKDSLVAITDSIKNVIDSINASVSEINKLDYDAIRDMVTSVKDISTFLTESENLINITKNLNSRKIRRLANNFDAFENDVKNLAILISRYIEILNKVNIADTLSNKFDKIERLKTRSLAVVDAIQQILDPLENLFSQLRHIKTRGIRRKARGIRRAIRSIHKIILTLMRRSVLSPLIVLPGVKALSIIVQQLAQLMKDLRTVGISGKIVRIILPLVLKAIKVVIRIEKYLVEFTAKITFKQIIRAATKIKLLSFAISEIRKLMVGILLLVPIAALFIIAAPILMIVLWMIAKITRMVIALTRRLIDPRFVLAILALVVINTAIMTLLLSVLGIAILAPMIIPALPAVGLVLLGVIALILIFALMGLALGAFLPLIGVTVAGIGLVAIAAAAILAIAAILWLLGQIKLDAERIVENVKLIMHTAVLVIMNAFAPIDDPRAQETDSSIMDIIESGPFRNFWGIIYACVQLAFLAIAVFAILIISVMLWILQWIKLDPTRILNNVSLIFDICQLIIDRVFQPDDVDVQASNKQGLEPLTQSTPSAFRRIIGSIFAVAYLAVMFIAVSCVLLISVMLRLLQNLNLNEAAILNNVEAVMNTCQTIIDSIFRPDDKDNNSSTRNLGIIGWAFPQLAPVLDSIFAMAYLAVMVLAVAALWGIAGILTQIEKIQLDKKKILNNVDAILDCVTSIINSIFLPDDVNKDSSERTLLKSFLLWVLPIGGIISAIFSMAYLAVMVISVLCLVGIAKMLGILEKTKIDEKKVKENVRKIINTCKYLTDNIFKPDDENKDKSDRTSLKGFLEWAFSGVSGIISIIQGIFSIAYLAVMIISVAIMVGIANLLKQLAEIDPSIFTTAKENVKAIIGVIDEIKNICFRPDEKTEESEHGVLMGIVKYFFGNGVADMLKGITTIGYVALMYFAVALMLGLSKMMVELANVDTTNIDKAASNADDIMKTTRDLIDKLMAPVEKQETEGDGWLTSAIRFVFGDQVAELAQAAAAMATLFPQLGLMYVVVGSLSKLSDMLIKINNLKIDDVFENNTISNASRLAYISKDILGHLETAFNNVEAADVTRYSEIIGAMSNMMPSFTSLASQFSNLSNFQWKIFEDAKNRAIISIRNIKDIFTELVPELKSGNSLNYEAKSALNDYTSAIRSSLMPLINEMSSMMNGLNNLATQISKVSGTNINTIQNGLMLGIEAFNVVKQIIFKILGNTDINSALTQLPIYRNAILEATRVLLQGKNMINAVGGLVNQINSTSEIGFDTLMNSSKFYQRALNEFNAILTNADQIRVDDANVRSTMDLLDRISQTVHNFVKVEEKDVKNSKNITDNYIKFLQQVDKMDYQKLNTTAWIMRSWASISRDLRGDFEGLSRTVNQHIMPMLNALNKTMDETTKCQKQIIDELTKPVTFGDTSGIQSYSDTPGTGTDITGGSGSTDSGLSVSTTSTQTPQTTTKTQTNRPHASQPKIDTDIKPGKYVVDLTKITPYN